MFDNHQPAKGGGKYGRDYERNSDDFKLKEDIHFFSGNLNIKGFIDWVADIDRFFDYMDVPEEKKVKLVVCRLKGGSSAW